MTQPAWLDKAAYPFESHFLAVEGKQLHYIDEGKGEVILFVHGTPSWSFEYRYAIRELSKNYRCIAPDHIGFGLSDKPADYDYSLEQHKYNLAKLIEHLQLNEFNLIVHDFGGPIGLSYAVDHPEKIKRLIIFNTWAWSIQQEKEFKKMKRIISSPLVPLLYKYFNFSAKYILPASYGERSRLTKDIHAQYLHPFAKASERKGTLAFAKALINQQEWFEQIWLKINALSEKPVLLIWGMKDQFITEKYLSKFLDAFPGATVIRYPDAGHFVMEEKSTVCIPAIKDFIGN